MDQTRGLRGWYPHPPQARKFCCYDPRVPEVPVETSVVGTLPTVVIRYFISTLIGDLLVRNFPSSELSREKESSAVSWHEGDTIAATVPSLFYLVAH